MTKIHEEVLRGRVSEALAHLKEREIKGEVVIIVEGFSGEAFKGPISDELKKALESGLSMKEAIEAVAKGLGIPKKEVYKEGLRLKSAK
jgi:16S rRNA (cytidine1402-2'-O)-methyltransferase